MKLLLNHSSQTINGFTHIRVTTGNVDIFGNSDIA